MRRTIIEMAVNETGRTRAVIMRIDGLYSVSFEVILSQGVLRLRDDNAGTFTTLAEAREMARTRPYPLTEWL